MYGITLCVHVLGSAYTGPPRSGSWPTLGGGP